MTGHIGNGCRRDAVIHKGNSLNKEQAGTLFLLLVITKTCSIMHAMGKYYFIHRWRRAATTQNPGSVPVFNLDGVLRRHLMSVLGVSNVLPSTQLVFNKHIDDHDVFW